MVVVDRKFTGAAAKATLLTSMTPTTPGAGGTITVDDDSGYPTTGKFEIVIDRTLINEESILINSRSGVTLTIGQRGYDGTVAGTHTSGVAFVEHDLSGRTVQLFVDHVDDVEADPHSTKLLNNTRHDVEVRHQFGSGLAFGLPVTPADVATAAAVGTGNNPSKEDHAHKIGTGAINVASMFAANVVDAAAIGSNAVTTVKINALAVTTAKIDDLGVTTAKINDLAVTTAKLADGSVTAVKTSFPATTADLVSASQSTTSASFVDLGTVGPSVTMTPPASGKVLVHLYCSHRGSAAGDLALMGFAVSGGNTIAASDDAAIGQVGNTGHRNGSQFLLTGLAASSSTFTAKYRAGGTAFFADRRLIVIPVLA